MVKVGDKIRILYMDGEPHYEGREGVSGHPQQSESEGKAVAHDAERGSGADAWKTSCFLRYL